MPHDALAVIQVGGYVNPWKVGIILVLLLVWAKLLTWIDKDSIEARLPRDIINTAMVACLLGGYFFFFILPGFPLAMTVLAVLFVVDIAAYLGMRSRTIGLSDLSEKFNDFWRGLLKGGKKKAVKAVAGQVLMMDSNGVAQAAPDAESPDLLRYEAAQQFLTKPLRLDAEKLELIAGEPTAVGYSVDGTKYNGEAMDRNRAGAAVQYLKQIAGLDMNERRKPQTGTFRANLDGKKFTIQITSRGSTAGESVLLVTNPKDRQNFKIDAMGFTEEQLTTIQSLIQEPTGVVLLAAPRGQGLTSLCYAMIRAHDAFLYHVHTIERAPEFDLEGVTQNALPAGASPVEEAKQVNWVVSQEPDVIMVTSLEDSHSAVDLAKFALSERRVYVGLRAGSTLDALRQWRKLVGDDGLALKSLRAVIAGRLVRRLCSACKVGYTPDPNTLRKLNMNPDTVGKLYQARKEPMRDAKGNIVPCTFCHDLAFRGRFGIYEVMKIDDEMRNLIKAGATDNQVKQMQHKQHGRLLQDIWLAQVRAGETSFEEVMRVLKQDSEQRPAAQPARTTAPQARGSALPQHGTPPPRGAAPPRPASNPAARPTQPRPAGPKQS